MVVEPSSLPLVVEPSSLPLVVEPSSLVVETFGPFLVPAVLFLVGACFYAIVVGLGRLRETEDYRADE